MGTPDTTPFRVDLLAEDGTVTLTLAGEVDLSVVDRIRTSFEHALEVPDAELVVDMGRVTFIDSAGIAALLHGRRAAAQDGRTLRLEHVGARTARVFELSGLTEVLTDHAGGQ